MHSPEAMPDQLDPNSVRILFPELCRPDYRTVGSTAQETPSPSTTQAKEPKLMGLIDAACQLSATRPHLRPVLENMLLQFIATEECSPSRAGSETTAPEIAPADPEAGWTSPVPSTAFPRRERDSIGVHDDVFTLTPFIEVFWPEDEAWYAGRVYGKRGQDGKWRVEYEDGDVERLDLSNGLETWRFVEKATVVQRRNFARIGHRFS
jgi:hypothetical protein